MPTDRKLGLFFAIIFLIVSLLPLIGSSRVNLIALGISGVFALIALTKPILLRPLNHLWMGLGRIFQRIFPPIFMLALYWIVFTPIALVTRQFSQKNIVDLRWKDSDRKSWWEQRDQPGPAANSTNKQY